ncbi:MAG: NUDIX hydrolase [Verrucomicrobia bacterium]|nr:NUDIX hydrolase [Cytophagales bacterium]
MLKNYFKWSLICLLVCTTLQAFSQKKDNYTFFKLYVSNEKGEILMVKWKGTWEVPGERYNDSLSIVHFLDKMATDCGIKVHPKQLSGLFTQYFQGRSNPTIFHWYSVKYISGTLKIPEDCEEIKWFSLGEAIRTTPYPVAKLIMKKIRANPGKVYGGAYQVNYNENPPAGTYKILEDFYLLN